ncbi:MAG: PQQ-binding-like beta-propeller repeat protein [bacterium]
MFRTMFIAALLVLLSLSAFAANAILGAADFLPTPAQPVGWRGDGSGHFPGATPPKAFDLGKKEGIAWSTAMPGPSFSSPIVVGDRVFTMADPHWLICCDAATGEIRWKADVDPLTLLPVADATKLRADLAAVELEIKALQDAKGDAKALENVNKKAAALAERGAVSAAINYGNFFGLTNPTPASDGERVYVDVSAGALAAYDLDGKKLWMVSTPHSGWSMGASSPVVVDGKVVQVFGARYKPIVAGFDAKTGAKLWSTPIPNTGHAGSGTPVVVVTPAGKRIALPVKGILDPADGTISSHEAWNMLGGSPAVSGDRIAYLVNEYHDKERFFAVVRATGKAGADGATSLFSVLRTSLGSNVASPLIVDEHCYNFDKGHLEVLNLTTGAVEYTSITAGKKSLPIYGNVGSSAPYGRAPSAALAGTNIYLPFGDGRVLILEPGMPPKVVATNMLEPMAGSPYFQGASMYVRTVNSLICVKGK